MAIYRQKGKRVLNEGFCVAIIDGDWKVPYIPGDVTNASTYPFPVVYHFLDDIDVTLILNGDPSQREPVIRAVKEIASSGVRGISGDCGFLIHYQADAARAVDIPVYLSSLLQLPLMDAILAGDRSIGIIAAVASSVDEDVIRKAGFKGRRELVIRGMQDSNVFASSLLQPSTSIDSDAAANEVIDLCLQMQQEHPNLGAYLFECSMLPPYSHAAHAATGLPVFDFVTMINYFQRASYRKEFTGCC
ncbi:MAG: aspartate/glutamate racemase family protein [Gammaproteobacteria bacterium]|nr:aspartate/glutamate racemase family protein [Gammaproteobacteria bacterium]